MRRAKYRAYDLKHNRMIEVIALGFLSNEAIGSDCALKIGSECKLMQYLGTDAKDMVGAEICEMDIVKCGDGLMYLVTQTRCGWNPFIDHMCTDKTHRYRVVGNYYQNLELRNALYNKPSKEP